MVFYADVEAAAARLADGVAHRTPVMTSRQANEVTGAEVFFKCENLQRTGAFKLRGAYNALAQFSDEQQARGVLTYSSGNHAQAVALAGRMLGIRATIIMPSDAPAVKRAATEGYGAEIVEYDRAATTREALADRLATERGLPVLPPYDHPHVVAGQGTAGQELCEDVPGLDALLVCCGGGGLLGGCAIAAKALQPDCRVVGVEPERADDAARSFRTGELHTVAAPDTIADGARTPSLGEVTFPLVREHADAFATVSEEAIAAATRFLCERLKLVVEPTGALAFAALLDGAVEAEGQRVGVTISGGNADLARLGSL
ncbi:MAG: threo-3-hydroxy-L-aspartate ammonia-lyase [Bacteroidetes bacterium QS_9_68_14]|nr:MAG: threo-3-hydroxy-L-aspartate ammonia-lyase [Bacteroidetes bacterium QS_9_68_14]